MDEIHRDKPTLNFLQRVYATSSDIISNSAEYFASFSIGQSVLKQTDRLLWTIEKSAEWFIPSTPASKQSPTSNGTFGKPSGPLVRPLPWLLFLPMLLFLRIVRLSLNIGAMLVGMETIKPSKMVRFIQVRRRRIRALKFLGLRRIRQKKMEKENQLTWKESFYSIMSRAMCFRVTNSDLYEQITVKNETQDNEPSTSKVKTKPKNGKDLKRKYMEILKNNYFDWDDVEDDEELIDRITQLAEEDSNDDSDFVPAEDSATEDDSMSDAEEDTNIPIHQPTRDLQRLTSQSSLTAVTIQEENEENSESDSTTVSANSDDETTQHMSAEETPKKQEIPPEKKLLHPTSSEATSDEFYSPINSMSTSPEPKVDEMNKQNEENIKQAEKKLDDVKEESKNLISSESKQDTTNAKSSSG